MERNTFDRRIQLGASRRRRKDSEVLHDANRWAGAVYLGGYVVECALKALICHEERRMSLSETAIMARGTGGNTLHNLAKLLAAVPRVQRLITNDRTHKLQQAWNTIIQLWKKDSLRYSDKDGSQRDSERFQNAVREIHTLLLKVQGEAS